MTKAARLTLSDDRGVAVRRRNHRPASRNWYTEVLCRNISFLSTLAGTTFPHEATVKPKREAGEQISLLRFRHLVHCRRSVVDVRNRDDQTPTALFTVSAFTRGCLSGKGAWSGRINLGMATLGPGPAELSINEANVPPGDAGTERREKAEGEPSVEPLVGLRESLW